MIDWFAKDIKRVKVADNCVILLWFVFTQRQRQMALLFSSADN